MSHYPLSTPPPWSLHVYTRLRLSPYGIVLTIPVTQCFFTLSYEA